MNRWQRAMRSGWGVCFFLVVLGATHPAEARSGGVVSLPPAGKRAKNGLQLTLDTRWVDANGYRPVRLRLSTVPPVPATADRTVRIVLKFFGYRGGFRTPTVTTFVELPEGAVSVDTAVAVPLNDTWIQVQTEVYEDGVQLMDLSERVGLPFRNYGDWSEAIPAVLVVHSDAERRDMKTAWPKVLPANTESTDSAARRLPDLRGLAMLLLSQQSYEVQQLSAYFVREEVSDFEIEQIASLHSRIDLLHPLDLPDRWIHYSSLDLVVISLADLERFYQEAKADQIWALRAWTSAGGTLMVHDVGGKYERLEQLERRLDLPPLAFSENEPHRGWALPTGSPTVTAVEGLPTVTNAPYAMPGAAITAPMIAGVPEVIPGNPPADLFLTREFGLGQVLAYGQASPFGRFPWNWRYLLSSLSPDRWAWYRRHGVSMNRSNDDYWNWLIAGVGRTPVFGFLVLITVFVVVTGPINYHLLRRRHRLALMVVTIPAAALVVTSGLFLYAVVHDGLGVRTRIRSVTHLDQRTGLANSWSRQTYYAGVSPSEGLVYPPDSVIYPLESNPSPDHRSFASAREVVWSNEQVLRRGYLAPRTMTQLIVGNSEVSERKLSITEASGPESPLRVVNGLGVKILLLALKDQEGRVYLGEGLAPGATVALPPSNAALLAKRWALTEFDHELQLPPDLDPNEIGRSAWFRTRVIYWNGVDNSLAPPTVRSSLLESRIRRIETGDEEKLARRSYWAVLESSPWVPLGYARSREQSSWHLLEGRW